MQRAGDEEVTMIPLSLFPMLACEDDSYSRFVFLLITMIDDLWSIGKASEDTYRE